MAPRSPRSLYFAYGSNMDRGEMERRCPGIIFSGPALLRGHRFIITRRGYASIVQDAAHVVHGLSWEATPAQLEALDHYESVGDGMYRRETLAVERPDGSRARMIVYVATDPRPGRPRPRYLELVIEAALREGLPAEYVAELRRWSAAG